MSRENTLLESLFNKVAGLQPCNFIKKSEIFEIFKNTYFKEHLSAASSENVLEQFFLEYLLLATFVVICLEI